jgi:hypothetical protein
VERFAFELFPELWTYFGVRSVMRAYFGPTCGPLLGVAEWPPPFAIKFSSLVSGSRIAMHCPRIVPRIGDGVRMVFRVDLVVRQRRRQRFVDILQLVLTVEPTWFRVLAD